MTHKPYFSIITATLNRREFIERAIQSVLAQNEPRAEHLIIDGGSTDGTLELLQRYPHLRVVSEPDRGVYDAMNKGIRLARGEVIGLLNSDDYYEPGAFMQASDIFKRLPGIDAVTGGANIVKLSGNGQWEATDNIPAIRPDDLPESIIFHPPIINAWFFTDSFLKKIGQFDIRYKISGDREFLIRAFLNKIKVISVDKIFYNFGMHSNSLTISLDRKKRLDYLAEDSAIAKHYLNQTEEFSSTFERWNYFLISEIIKTSIRIGEYNIAASQLRMLWEENPLLIIKICFNNLYEINRLNPLKRWKDHRN